MERLNVELFTWSRWRYGASIMAELGICGNKYIRRHRQEAIRKHAVGYVEGERLGCRPKPGDYAIMLFWDGHHGWFHLTEEEFITIEG